MLDKRRSTLIVAVVMTLLSSYALMTHHGQFLLHPAMQLVLGMATASTLVEAIAAFRKKKKGSGLVLTFLTLFMLTVIIANNTMTVGGIVPVLTMYMVLGVPVALMALFAHRISENREIKHGA
ncbi:hypothetical protein EQV77_13145 [Halobacillus fulvus]|nr:hypothetical protein EQV77_13145 [Halobacillus fulvus]